MLTIRLKPDGCSNLNGRKKNTALLIIFCGKIISGARDAKSEWREQHFLGEGRLFFETRRIVPKNSNFECCFGGYLIEACRQLDDSPN